MEAEGSEFDPTITPEVLSLLGRSKVVNTSIPTTTQSHIVQEVSPTRPTNADILAEKYLEAAKLYLKADDEEATLLARIGVNRVKYGVTYPAAIENIMKTLDQYIITSNKE